MLFKKNYYKVLFPFNETLPLIFSLLIIRISQGDTTEKSKTIFKTNIKTQKIKLIKTEHYDVKYAKTARMKQSAIINMTKQINK